MIFDDSTLEESFDAGYCAHQGNERYQTNPYTGAHGAAWADGWRYGEMVDLWATDLNFIHH